MHPVANIYIHNMLICGAGVDAGPSPDLVSQMMEEALGQTDHVLLGKERSG